MRRQWLRSAELCELVEDFDVYDRGTEHSEVFTWIRSKRRPNSLPVESGPAGSALIPAAKRERQVLPCRTKPNSYAG